MFRNRKSKGFTLIELLTVVVVIGILAAIALPDFIGAQTKAKLAQVKSNMHTCQLASESYATDTAGLYSGTVAGLAPYYPGGGNSLTGAAGNYPQNPFTGSPNAPDTAAAITNVSAARSAPAGSTTGTSGDVLYDTGLNPSSYAVIGFDSTGQSVAGNTGTQLVLSNQ